MQIPKPSGFCRILFLGDSVPGQGYPNLVEKLLNGKQSAQYVESVNLALAGYSSHQGRAVVNKYGAVVDPDLVVISYGWNDHWLAYGSVDSQKVINVNPSWGAELFSMSYRHIRLLQWSRYLLTPLLGADQPLADVRVSTNEYADNLTFMGRFFSDRGVPVIFITPPTAHYRLGVPDYLIRQGFAVDKNSVITLHRRYNQILREVAAKNSWLVLDLEREFETGGDLSKIFLEDGIHLTGAGLAVIAARISDFRG